MIKKCTYEHKDQDKMHGRGNRVHNPTTKDKRGEQVVYWRCTVCKDMKR